MLRSDGVLKGSGLLLRRGCVAKGGRGTSARRRGECAPVSAQTYREKTKAGCCSPNPLVRLAGSEQGLPDPTLHGPTRPGSGS